MHDQLFAARRVLRVEKALPLTERALLWSSQAGGGGRRGKPPAKR